ncbi:MAG TPA: hypothetical protein ENN40_06935 [Candidatus Aminicenantes bacterium]|nr:hypothetical protein [Candidatus Aminicenantes bacterium]
MTGYANNLENGLPAEYYSDLDQYLAGRRLPLKLDEFMGLEFSYFLSWRHNQTPMRSQPHRKNQATGTR